MESRLAARNGGRLGIAGLVAILLLGLGLRLGEAWDGRAPVYDAAAYAAIAANLERGEGFTVGAEATQPSSNYSPGLPLIVAGVYELTGGVHERLARVLLALVGTLGALFAYLLGRRLFGFAAGLVAALAVAVYPALVEYQGMLMSEPLAATLLSGAVLAIFWAWDGGSLWRWLLPGALLGVLTLTRPEYLGVSVLLAAAVALLSWQRLVANSATNLCHQGWRRGLAAGGVLLAGLALVVVPWTVRNVVALDRVVPVSTGGGQVLFAGTYLPSDGDPEKVGAGVVDENPDLFGPDALERLRLEQILARLAAREYPRLESDQALARMGREQLWDDVSGAPLEYAGFLAAKLWRVWGHGPRAVMREPGWELLHWALVGFALLGLGVLIARRRPEAVILATILLAITAVSLLLVASPRRFLVLLPLVAALAGVGVAWVGSRAATRPSRRDSLSRP